MEQIRRGYIKEMLEGLAMPLIGHSRGHRVLNIKCRAIHQADIKILAEIFPRSIISTAAVEDADGYFDIVIAKCFLHEAAIYGKDIKEEFEKLMAIDFNRLVIIDYLDNPDIDWDYFDTFNASNQDEFSRFTVDVTPARQFKKFKGDKLMVYTIKKIKKLKNKEEPNENI